MKKIPVKIVELTSPSGKKAVDVMIDVFDYHEIENAQEKIRQFKKNYFDLVKKAQDIMPQKKAMYKSKNSKRRSKDIGTGAGKKASFYWEIGNLFRKFNDDMKNTFEITNYNNALERDFGLSQSYVKELMIFSKLFKKKEIVDFIPMAIYRALVWKKIQLEEVGELKNEKARLLKRGKNKERIERENYKKELNALIKSKKRSKKLKIRQ